MTPDHSALIERLEGGCIFHPRHYWIVEPDKTDALLAEAAAAIRDLTKWRDIATAPKDGTKVLCWSYRPLWKEPAIAFWGRSNPLNRQAWLGGHCRIDHIDQPTHWLPLPSAPNQAKEAG